MPDPHCWRSHARASWKTRRSTKPVARAPGVLRALRPQQPCLHPAVTQRCPRRKARTPLVQAHRRPEAWRAQPAGNQLPGQAARPATRTEQPAARAEQPATLLGRRVVDRIRCLQMQIAPRCPTPARRAYAVARVSVSASGPTSAKRKQSRAPQAAPASSAATERVHVSTRSCNAHPIKRVWSSVLAMRPAKTRPSCVATAPAISTARGATKRAWTRKSNAATATRGSPVPSHRTYPSQRVTAPAPAAWIRAACDRGERASAPPKTYGE